MRSWEFIPSEITRDIMELTSVVLVQPRKGFCNYLMVILMAFWVEIIVGQLEADLEPKACGSLDSFKKKDHVVSSCYLGLEVSFSPCP